MSEQVAPSLPTEPAAASKPAHERLIERPALIFILLSLGFGLILLILTPPLRGPDETAHFLRVYGLSRGEIVPWRRVDGRLGLLLPPEMHAQFSHFEDARHRAGREQGQYRRVFEEYWQSVPRGQQRQPEVFVPYQGAEAYSPAPYLPLVATGLVAQLLQLDFLTTLYLMRLGGLLAWTALIALAIATTPRLKWAFVLLAMWPSVLYPRGLVSADGASFAYTLMFLALCLRSAHGMRTSIAQRSLWCTLSSLCKPPNLAFIVMESMAHAERRGRRLFPTLLVVMLPGLILGPLWVYAISADVAAWRLTAEGKISPQELEPLWKLAFMWENPWHFPRAALATLKEHWHSQWRQLVGVHGWLDNPMPGWIYPALSVLLLIPIWERFALPLWRRIWVGGAALLAAGGYMLAVYIIFFLTWTPIASHVVWGIQGRYFTVLLPLLALGAAILVNREMPARLRSGASLAGSALSLVGTIQALYGFHWGAPA